MLEIIPGWWLVFIMAKHAPRLGWGFIPLDSSRAAMHVQRVSLRSMFVKPEECAIHMCSWHNGWPHTCKKYSIKVAYEWPYCTCFVHRSSYSVNIMQSVNIHVIKIVNKTCRCFIKILDLICTFSKLFFFFLIFSFFICLLKSFIIYLFIFL